MRKSMIAGFILCAAALALLVQADAQITDQKKADKKITDKKVIDTVITVEDLDCEACAETVKLALEDLKGVAKIKIDVDNQRAIVTPKADVAPSPKLMWEAVEECGFVPTKMEGPGGTFTKKPPS